MAAARSLATVMAVNNMSLVYGGGTVGLMGEVARTLVSLSGPESVHGIIPAPLVKYERGIYIPSLLSIHQSCYTSLLDPLRHTLSGNLVADYYAHRTTLRHSKRAYI